MSQSGSNTVTQNELSPTDRAILDGIDYVGDTLIPQVEVLFKKVVTFANDVVFQSRVIFSDPDMAGQISIPSGKTQVYVEFKRPYSGVPVITLTPVGHFHMGVVSESSKYGFTIEIENSASRSLLFNWVALMVNGAASSHTALERVPETTREVPKESAAPVSQSVSGEETIKVVPSTAPEDQTTPSFDTTA